jgi:predicted DNA-binding transcriptional regulator YafY
LSWGSKAKVIGPAELKERVRSEVEKMAQGTKI